MSTKIEWADMTINPVVGCTKCSDGCRSCYAERFAARMVRHPNPKISGKYADVVDEHGKWTGKTNITDHMDFSKLYGMRKSKRIFVGSMTDLFHASVSIETLRDIFSSMSLCSQHTFMLLTKRPERMADFLRENFPTPLPNVWLGVTVCNHDELWKLDTLREIPAALRYVSFEPLLSGLGKVNLEGIGWVICGGETGPGARPMHPDWVRDLRDQCQGARVPFFFKGWGEWVPCSQCADDDPYIERLSRSTPYTEIGDDGITDTDTGEGVICRNGVNTEQIFRIGKRRVGRLLDGRTWDEFPEGELC